MAVFPFGEFLLGPDTLHNFLASNSFFWLFVLQCPNTKFPTHFL
jgi:hypothetical protein